MKQFNFSFFNIYKYDSDCWGLNLLTIGMNDRSLIGLNADEDGTYLTLFWLIEIAFMYGKRY